MSLLRRESGTDGLEAAVPGVICAAPTSCFCGDGAGDGGDRADQEDEEEKKWPKHSIRPKLSVPVVERRAQVNVSPALTAT
jgi:hypothetical protein